MYVIKEYELLILSHFLVNSFNDAKDYLLLIGILSLIP